MASTPARVRIVTSPLDRMSRTTPPTITSGASATRSPLTSAALAFGTSPVVSTTGIEANVRTIATGTAARTSGCSARAAQTDTARVVALSARVTIRDQLASGAATWKEADTSTSSSTSTEPCGRDLSRTPASSTVPTPDLPGVGSPAMRKWLPMLILASAQFIMVLDSSVMNVAISQIVEDLDTTIQGVQTAITLYTLVMAAFMLLGAKLGDILGRNRAFAIGLAIYGVGSLTTALSPNLAVLLVGWSGIEGFGAVLVVPAIAALTAASYEGNDRALAYALLGGIAASRLPPAR